MNNFYQEGNNSDKTENLSSAGQTPQGQNGANPTQNGAPVYYQTGQPVYPPPPPNFVQQPYPPQANGAPQGYYYAQPPQGAPMPYFQLTPEQIAILLQQYVVPMQYTQAPPPPPQQNVPADENAPGMRILYQSPDFDSANENVHQESYDYEEDENEEDGGEYTEPDFQVKEHIVVEEETLTRPEPKKEMPEEKTEPPASRKGSFSVDDMEMSTFELDSIMLRRDSVKEEKKPLKDEVEAEFFRPQKVGYASAGFSVEETYEETTEQIFTEKIEHNTKNGKTKQTGSDKKKISKGEIIRRIILGISVVAIIISSAMIVKEFLLSRENANLEDEVSGLIIEDTTKPDEEKTTDKTEQQQTTEKVLTAEEQWAQIKAENPNVVFPDFMQLKYAKLYATNQDFVGYLEIDGLDLSLPVVQGDDDSEYLEKNFYGKKTKYGCPFVTHYNNMLTFDMNTIIFGHHMNNGSVFGVLDEYKSIEGFKTSPVISFNTLYADYNWKVIAAFITNADPKDDNGYVFKYYFTNLSTRERFSAYLSELSQRSLYDTGVDVLPTDKLLTLSTCSYEFDNARFVVVARLVRDGESTEVDTSKATVNGNPRYPQAYYDAKKIKTNPYANASKWEVE